MFEPAHAIAGATFPVPRHQYRPRRQGLRAEPTTSAALVSGKVFRFGVLVDGKDIRIVGIRREGVEFEYFGERVFVPRMDATAVDGPGSGSSKKLDASATVPPR